MIIQPKSEEIGRLVRAHRKQRQLTLETVSGLSNLSIRFLSEFERSKDTAEIGKILRFSVQVGAGDSLGGDRQRHIVTDQANKQVSVHGLRDRSR